MAPLPTAAALGALSEAEHRSLRAAETAGAAFLMIQDGSGARVVRPLADALSVTLGRHAGCDVALHWDEKVSRTHAVLERLGHAWTVADEGLSRNGTFLNGERLTSRRRLVDRDVIRLGRTVILFRDPADRVASSTVPEAGGSKPQPLTPAQRRVLIELCRPYKGGGFATPASNAEIAAALVLTVDAIKTHMRALFARFEVGDLPQNQKRARVVERAFEAGVVTERDL